MMHTLVRHFLRLSAALMLMAATISSAHAQVSCSANMSNVNFGAINPLSATASTASATLSYTCTNSNFFSRQYVNVCFNIGDGGGAGGTTGAFNPRRMNNGASALNMQLYNGGTIWGSKGNAIIPNPATVQLTINAASIFGSTSVSGSIALTGQVLGGQNLAIPGNYLNDFSGWHTSISLSASSFSMPSDCTTNSGSFPFQVTATVFPQCQITATNKLDFGTRIGTNIAVAPGGASAGLSVQCTNTTPYQIGLTPSNGNSGGYGTMVASGAVAGNTDSVKYNLYRDAAGSQPWGNVMGSNTSTGSGTGAVNNTTVYGGLIHQAVTPDTYKDTVTVTVTY